MKWENIHEVTAKICFILVVFVVVEVYASRDEPDVLTLALTFVRCGALTLSILRFFASGDLFTESGDRSFVKKTSIPLFFSSIFSKPRFHYLQQDVFSLPSTVTGINSEINARTKQ